MNPSPRESSKEGSKTSRKMIRVVLAEDQGMVLGALAALLEIEGDIATELGLSDGTVRNYLSEVISKLGAGNRVEAARIARTKGWL